MIDWLHAFTFLGVVLGILQLSLVFCVLFTTCRLIWQISCHDICHMKGHVVPLYRCSTVNRKRILPTFSIWHLVCQRCNYRLVDRCTSVAVERANAHEQYIYANTYFCMAETSEHFSMHWQHNVNYKRVVSCDNEWFQNLDLKISETPIRHPRWPSCLSFGHDPSANNDTSPTEQHTTHHLETACMRNFTTGLLTPGTGV